MDKELMLKRIRAMQTEYRMPWKYRVVLAWCVAMIYSEMANDSR